MTESSGYTELDVEYVARCRAAGALELVRLDLTYLCRAVVVIAKRRGAALLTSGGGGIRTHEALARPTVFKTAPFDRSGTPPERIVTDYSEGRIAAGAP